MAFEYSGFVHRDLEPQVRYDAEQIELLKQVNIDINNKIDALPLGGEKVSLTFPAGASEGTITADQLTTLQASDANYIEMVNDKELYYLNDPGHVEGYLTYSHVGIENSKATIKTLTITVSAKSFVIVTTIVPTDAGGGKLYSHLVQVTFNFDDKAPVYMKIPLYAPTNSPINTLEKLVKYFPDYYEPGRYAFLANTNGMYAVFLLGINTHTTQPFTTYCKTGDDITFNGYSSYSITSSQITEL